MQLLAPCTLMPASETGAELELTSSLFSIAYAMSDDEFGDDELDDTDNLEEEDEFGFGEDDAYDLDEDGLGEEGSFDEDQDPYGDGENAPFEEGEEMEFEEDEFDDEDL
jgi:hypothetical protein